MNDVTFLQSFENGSLPIAEWTHRAHVKVAFLYLQKYEFDDALSMMRQGVKAYNASHGVIDSATSGYNETTTAAFMRLVHAIDTAYRKTLPTPDAETFCDTHPQLLSKHVLRFFYSPGRRLHPDAKHSFVPPDLAPLPMATA